ncbi:MAG: hypothetical protein WBK19_15595 [Azonexus sp.]
MNSADYLSLIDVLKEQLDLVGASGLADPRHYVKQDPETGEHFLLEPRQRLLEMLQAFERFLAVRDKTTLENSLERINRPETSPQVETVEVLSTPGEGAAEPANFEGLEYLGDVRASLRELIYELRNDEERR